MGRELNDHHEGKNTRQERHSCLLPREENVVVLFSPIDREEKGSLRDILRRYRGKKRVAHQ